MISDGRTSGQREFSTLRRRSVAFLRQICCLLLGIVFAVGEPLPANAQEVRWESDWDEYGLAHGAVTLGLFAGGGALLYGGVGAPTTPNWIGGVLIDDTVHEHFVASSPQGIVTAAAASDLLLYSLVAYPVLIDPALTWLGHDDASKVAVQTALISLQSLAVTFFLTSLSKNFIGRRRPPVGDCFNDPLFDPFCTGRETVSFPSGHASMAFTGAALACAHHDVIPMYGGGWDDAACYVSLTAAGTTAFLRITSNNHYFSDIFIGGLLGFASGYFIPKWLHFGFGDSDDSELQGTLIPMVGADSSRGVRGLNYHLRF